MDKDKLLGLVTSEHKILDKIDAPKTVLERGIEHFGRAFAWYCLVLSIIVIVIFGFGLTLGIEIGTQTFWIYSMIGGLSGTLVYFAFSSYGKNDAMSKTFYITKLDNYVSARNNKSRESVQARLNELNENDKQVFIKMVESKTGLTYDQIKNSEQYIFGYMTKKEYKQKYSRKQRKLINIIKKGSWRNRHPDNPEIVLQAYANDYSITKGVSINAQKQYERIKAVQRLTLTLVFMMLTGSIIVQAQNLDVTQLILTTTLGLIGLVSSMGFGYMHGKTAINSYRCSIIQYLTDILNSIKEQSENSKESSNSAMDTSDSSHSSGYMEVENGITQVSS